MTDYPKVQYSVFVGGQRGKQFVLRGETIEEIAELKRELDEQILSKMEESVESEGHDEPTYKCEKCKGPAALKTGISKKTDKEWKGIFCRDEMCKEVKWL